MSKTSKAVVFRVHIPFAPFNTNSKGERILLQRLTLRRTAVRRRNKSLMPEQERNLAFIQHMPMPGYSVEILQSELVIASYRPDHDLHRCDHHSSLPKDIQLRLLMHK